MPDETQVTETQTHWTEAQESFTPEMKQAFAKYATPDDAFKGAFEAQKMTGKPFKLPESLDKLDDKTRVEFKASIGKLLGAIEKPEDLKDINLTVGMPEGGKPDDGIVAVLNKWAIGKPKDVVQETIQVWNEAQETAKKQMEANYLAQSKVTEEELIKPERFGSKEKYLAASELIKRMFSNIKGMTPEKFESIGKYLVDTRSLHSADYIEAMSVLAEAHAGEGSTETGDGGKPPEHIETDEERLKRENPKTTAALNW